MIGLLTSRATQICGCWGILMHRKCKYKIFGYFMKVTVPPILPGEAMLESSFHQKLISRMGRRGCQSTRLNFCCRLVPFSTDFGKYFGFQRLLPAFPPLFGCLKKKNSPYIYVYKYIYVFTILSTDDTVQCTAGINDSASSIFPRVLNS